MVDHRTMKLGRKPPKLIRSVKLAKYTTALPAAPAMADWTTTLTNLGMMLNDTLGDCVPAAGGHQEQAWTAANKGQVIPPDSAIEMVYEAACGYNPSNPSTDQGCVISDVLAYWQKTGVSGLTIDAYASVSLSNQSDVMDAVAFFGGCFIGLNLPLAWQTATEWDAPPNGQRPRGQWAPGSWGGHCVPVLKYDSTGVWVVTWGSIMKMTWAAWAIYVEEAWALLSKQWATAVGSPAGTAFDWAALAADVTALDGPTPAPPTPVPPTPTPPTPTQPPSHAAVDAALADYEAAVASYVASLQRPTPVIQRPMPPAQPRPDPPQPGPQRPEPGRPGGGQRGR
jgi:hypothetical protein